MLMPLSEEEWFNEQETYTLATKYLAPLAKESIDNLILGCTPIKEALSEQVKVIDPAVAVAEEAMRALRDRGLEVTNASPKHIYARLRITQNASNESVNVVSAGLCTTFDA